MQQDLNLVVQAQHIWVFLLAMYGMLILAACIGVELNRLINRAVRRAARGLEKWAKG